MGQRLDGILNLFEIPHLGRSQEVNACFNMLLNCVHGGYLLLDRPNYIDTHFLIHRLTIIGGRSHLIVCKKKE
jgi:hypothetical protein